MNANMLFICYVKMLNILTSNNIDCLIKVKTIALTPGIFKMPVNHQKGDPGMRMPSMFICYVKMLNILTIISDNFDCLKKVNKTDEAIALTPPP